MASAYGLRYVPCDRRNACVSCLVHSRNGRRRHEPPFASIHALTSLSSGGGRSVRAVNVAASNVFVAGSNPGCAAPPRHSRSCAPRPRRNSSAVSAASAAITGSYTFGTTIGGGSPAPSKPSIAVGSNDDTAGDASPSPSSSSPPSLLSSPDRGGGGWTTMATTGTSSPSPPTIPLARRIRTASLSTAHCSEARYAGVTIATTPAHDSHASSLASARSSVDVTSVPSSDASSHASRTRSPLDSPGGAIVRTSSRMAAIFLQ
mmetsp:Transcript_11143/g.50468  ORF Transcript_11143/g.50468 Transcript_11143/m.50468 type:complete len:261 (-) Transcript_11143:391-1173(-)